MSTLTDQLRQLEEEILKHDKAATKGPWTRDDHAYPPERTVCDRDCIIVATVTNENSRDLEGQRIEQEANLDLIAFARTALLDLLAVAKGLQDKLDRLPADWFEDASLETWFPLTAEEVKSLRAENERQRQALEWIKNLEVAKTDGDRLFNILAMKTKADEALSK